MSAVDVLDDGRLLSFSYQDMLRYHGPGSPGGVAHAFKVMERAFLCWTATVRSSGVRSP